MSSSRLSHSAFLALLICGVAALPLRAATPGKQTRTPARPAGVPSDGTVTGTLTVNGTKLPLTHIYRRKREAWPAVAGALRAGDRDELCRGRLELTPTRATLPAA